MAFAVLFSFAARADVQMLEYIQASGKASVDTGYVAGPDTVIAFKGMYVDRNNQTYAALFKAYTAEAAVATRFILNNTSVVNFYASCYSQANQTYVFNGAVAGQGCVITGLLDRATNTYIVNGVSASGEKPVGSLTETTVKLHDPDKTAVTRLYYFTVSENGTVLHDFRPCIKNGDIGYIDLVSDLFYMKTGLTGTLKAGPLLGEADPIAHFRFDEAAPLKDDVNDADMTIVGTPHGLSFRKGIMRFGEYASQLDSSGKLGSALSVQTAVTFEMFVRPDYSCPFGKFQVSRRALFSGGRTSTTPLALDIPETVPRAICANVNSGFTVTTPANTFLPNVWHHVALTVDRSKSGSDAAVLYVDGVAYPLTGSGTPAVLGSSLYSWVPGWNPQRNYGNNPMYLGGDFDELRISRGVLDPSQFMKTPSIDVSTPPAGAKIWKGGVGLPLWSEPSNWEGGEVPVAGDTVFIGEGRNCVLTDSTPALTKLIVEGTLVSSNWMTKVQATDVAVQNTGMITCWGPFTDQEMSNRVWIACENLSVDASGAIDVSACGYAGGDAAHTSGYGPAGGSGTYGPSWGAAHGGPGNFSFNGNSAVGDEAYPTLPGSGGSYYHARLVPGAGGGAIRIDATGIVTVDGRLAANGEEVPMYGSRNLSDCCTASGGAGGSILVTCATFAGTRGRLVADGANAQWRAFPSAGGRIAVHYDPGRQSAAMVDHVFFSARAGTTRKDCSTTTYTTDGDAAPEFDVYDATYLGYNSYMYAYQHVRAGAGSIWFTDGTLLHEDSIGSDFAGRLCSTMTALETTGDLVISNWVGLSGGFELKVKGDLTFVGPDGRLDLGASELLMTNRIVAARYSPIGVSKLTVTGDLTLGEHTRMDVYPSCIGTDDGAVVTVGGTMTVMTNACLYPFSGLTNGASVLFDVGSFHLNNGGLVGLMGAGFGAGMNGPVGYGPGVSVGTDKLCRAAGHGGRGGTFGTDDTKRGQTYDDALRPSQPGSGGTGGANSTRATGGGGGYFHLRAAAAAVVDGTIEMSAHPWQVRDYSAGGQGSGGAILIDCQTFSGGATAVMKADGGMPQDRGTDAGGGGGRVAVWYGKGMPWSASIPVRRYSDGISTVPPTSYLGTVSVLGGRRSASDLTGVGEDGTIRFVELPRPSGTIIIIR